jgi:hypothetical protein
MLQCSVGGALRIQAGWPFIVQCNNEDTSMAKAAVAFETPKLNPVPGNLPEPKLPKFDLDALFRVQTANLAAAHEVQCVLVDAAQAVARVRYGYVQQAVADAKAAFGPKQPPKPEAVLAEVRAAAEKAHAVAKEVVDLTVGAQKRVAELVTRRVQASVAALKAPAA